MAKSKRNNYSREDKYRHQLGILRTIMRKLCMDDNCHLSDIPKEIDKLQNNVDRALYDAAMLGVGFIELKADGSIIRHNPQDVVVKVKPEAIE